AVVDFATPLHPHQRWNTHRDSRKTQCAADHLLFLEAVLSSHSDAALAEVPHFGADGYSRSGRVDRGRWNDRFVHVRVPRVFPSFFGGVWHEASVSVTLRSTLQIHIARHGISPPSRQATLPMA